MRQVKYIGLLIALLLMSVAANAQLDERILEDRLLLEEVDQELKDLTPHKGSLVRMGMFDEFRYVEEIEQKRNDGILTATEAEEFLAAELRVFIEKVWDTSIKAISGAIGVDLTVEGNTTKHYSEKAEEGELSAEELEEKRIAFDAHIVETFGENIKDQSCFSRSWDRSKEIYFKYDDFSIATFAFTIEFLLCETEITNCGTDSDAESFSCGVTNGLLQEVNWIVLLDLAEGISSVPEDFFKCLSSKIKIGRTSEDELREIMWECMLGATPEDIVAGIYDFIKENWTEAYYQRQATAFTIALISPFKGKILTQVKKLDKFSGKAGKLDYLAKAENGDDLIIRARSSQNWFDNLPQGLIDDIEDVNSPLGQYIRDNPGGVNAWSAFKNKGLDDLARSTDDLEIVSDYVTRSGKSIDDVAGEIPSNISDARKWLGDRKIEPFLDGNPQIVNLSSPPTGYEFVSQADGSKYIRRINASDPYTPRLMVDETGKVVRYTKPQRLASNGLLRSRLESALGSIPENHQVHHLVPSNVAENSVLHQEALSRNLYDVDRISNGKVLAESAEDFAPISEGLPTHFGSHPNYDAEINDVIGNVLNTPRSWAPGGVNVDDLPSLTPEQITELIDDVEFEALGVLEDWVPAKLN